MYEHENNYEYTDGCEDQGCCAGYVSEQDEFVEDAYGDFAEMPEQLCQFEQSEQELPPEPFFEGEHFPEDEQFSAQADGAAIAPLNVAPTITFPGANATVPWNAVTVTWNLVNNASYRLSVQNVTTNNMIVPERALAVGTRTFLLPLTQLAPGQRFRIRLASVVSGVVRWAPNRDFFMQSIATPVPTITNPAANARVPRQLLTVRWDAVAGATSYLVSLRDLTTNTLVINRRFLTGTNTTVQANQLLAGHRYRVAVASVFGTLERWSEREFFARADAERLSMAQVMQLPNGWHTVTLIDLWTGKRFNIRWHRRADHTDWSPVSPADVQVIQGILNPTGDTRNWSSRHSWSWNARPGMVTVSGRRIAVGIHLFPHDIIMSGASPGLPLRSLSGAAARYPDGNWRVGGHMCMYYGGSAGGGNATWERSMNDAAVTAAGM